MGECLGWEEVVSMITYFKYVGPPVTRRTALSVSRTLLDGGFRTFDELPSTP